MDVLKENPYECVGNEAGYRSGKRSGRCDVDGAVEERRGATQRATGTERRGDAGEIETRKQK